MYLYKDVYEEYVKWYVELWLEMKMVFKKYGVMNYLIFLNKLIG